MGQVAFLFGLFLGENVRLKSVLALDFASSGQLKALLGTGLGFHFRHFTAYLVFDTPLLLGRDHHDHALAFQLGHTFYFTQVFQILR